MESRFVRLAVETRPVRFAVDTKPAKLPVLTKLDILIDEIYPAVPRPITVEPS